LGDDSFKKETEIEVLDYFNPIYEEVVGDFLEIVEAGERPDFICKRKDGTLVGVELVQVCRGHPNDVFYDKNINKNLTMVPDQVLDLIQSIIYTKEEKRKSKTWRLSEKTILIIHLQESPLWEIANALTEELFPDLKEYGFIEIWVADLSELEAYNDIELFCLFPPNISGYYKRPPQKPYG